MTFVEPTELFCVVGMARSGTIWLTRLLADTLNIQSRTRASAYDDYEKDPVVWGLDRPGNCIRRLHYRSRGYEFNAPVVLIIRDPRAVALSQCHYYKKPDFHAHALWLAARWLEFYSEWVGDSRVSSIVRYESLLASTHVEIVRVINDLELSIPDDEYVDRAIYNNDFSRMENYAKRRGEVDEWKRELESRTSDAVREVCLPIIKEFGYE